MHLLRFTEKNNKIIAGSGFTLIEVIVAVGILAILAGLGMFLTMDFYRGYAFNYEKNLAVSLLQKARSKAMANINQSEHGFCFNYANREYAVFEKPNNSINCSNATKKETFPVSSTIGPTTNVEVVFEQLSGDVSSSVDIEFTGPGHAPAHITINEEGRINY